MKPRAAAVVIAGVMAVAAVGVAGAPTAHADGGVQEQEGHHGADTFSDYHNASGVGPRIDPGAVVTISCKVYDPYIQSASPDGYWYQIASSPWNNAYYAVANTFMNGDPWDGPYTHNTDFNVPDCGSQAVPPPDGSDSPPSSAPETQPQAALLQGPSAAVGYWYDIRLSGFSPNAGISITCYDSASPNGFRSFVLTTDATGSAQTSDECRSGDGPDHWFVADGTASSHAAWQALPAPAPVANQAPNPPENPTSQGPSTGSTGPQSAAEPAPENCTAPSGTRIANEGWVWYSLYNHYMWGGGSDATIDWSFFTQRADFVSSAKQLGIGESKQFTPGKTGNDADMWLALRTFTIKRSSTSCYVIWDHYDFNPSSLEALLADQPTSSALKPVTDIITLPEWAYQLSGAKEFWVYGGGTLS